MESNIEIIEYNIDEIKNYMDIINEIKARITLDKNGLTDEVRELIFECKEEIESLRKSISDLQDENMKIFEDNCTMARQLYVNEKLSEVKSETKKDKLKKLLLSSDEDVKYLDQNNIDRIFGEV